MANEKLKFAIMDLLSRNASEMSEKVNALIEELTPAKTIEVEDLVNQIKASLDTILSKAADTGDVKPV